MIWECMFLGHSLRSAKVAQRHSFSLIALMQGQACGLVDHIFYCLLFLNLSYCMYDQWVIIYQYNISLIVYLVCLNIISLFVI